MIHDCDNCKHAETPAFFEPCASCGGSSYWEPYVQTNADRIRAMTDEELAKHHSKLVGCPKTVVVYRGCPAAPECNASACWLDWLRQEVAE